MAITGAAAHPKTILQITKLTQILCTHCITRVHHITHNCVHHTDDDSVYPLLSSHKSCRKYSYFDGGGELEPQLCSAAGWSRMLN